MAEVPKPTYGSACNGCGFCCLAEPCQIATALMGWVGPCPALEHDGGRYWCGMVRHPSRYIAGHFPAADQTTVDGFVGAMFARALGIGIGCDADD